MGVVLQTPLGGKRRQGRQEARQDTGVLGNQLGMKPASRLFVCP